MTTSDATTAQCNPSKHGGNFTCDRPARSKTGLELCATHYMQRRRRKRLMPIEVRCEQDLVDISVRVRPGTFQRLRQKARDVKRKSGRHTGAQRIARRVLEAYLAQPSGEDMREYLVSPGEGPIRRYMGTRGMTIAVAREVKDAFLAEYRRRLTSAGPPPSAPAVAAEVLERWADSWV